MNRAEEDYIKLIHELHDETKEPFIKGATLAEQFEFTLQSVNEMLKRLEKKGYLTYTPYKGVKLTSVGRQEAIRLIRAHRIWEVFLAQKLGLPWEALHQEAERLEHASSDEVIERLHQYLGYPQYCHHGNPIPNADGSMAEMFRRSLLEAPLNKPFEVKRVLDHKPLLKHLNQLNIQLHDVLKVIEKDDFAGIIKIEKDTQQMTFSHAVARMIFGE